MSFSEMARGIGCEGRWGERLWIGANQAAQVSCRVDSPLSPSHQVSTSGVVPYLSLLSAVLGTELALSKRLLNE